MFVEEGGGPKRTDGPNPTEGRVGRIEGEERNVSVGDNIIEDIEARYGHDGRVRRVYGVPTEGRR